MNQKILSSTDTTELLQIAIKTNEVRLLIIGGGDQALKICQLLLMDYKLRGVTVISSNISNSIKALNEAGDVQIIERDYAPSDFYDFGLIIAADDNNIINEQIKGEAAVRNVLVHVADAPELSDFIFSDIGANGNEVIKRKNFIERLNNGEVRWRRLASQLIVVFALMVVGHILISYLPLPSGREVWLDIKPHLTGKFFCLF